MVAMSLRTKTVGLAKSAGQSALSLSFDLAGMLAGTLLAIHLDTLSLAPWALVLFPGILTVRGTIGGLLSGRLSTGLHVGTVKARYTKNTKEFYLLLQATLVLTLGSSIVMGLATSLLGAFLWGVTITDLAAILAVITATMALSIAFISPITVGVSMLAFKHGLDPDVIVYPVISTVADILVTACYFMVLDAYFLPTPLGSYLIGLISFIFSSIAFCILFKNSGEIEFSKTVNEFLHILILIVFIVNVTGLILGKINQIIGSRPEIYVVYPALIDTVGDVGSIVGSTATTKLALGVIEPDFPSIKQHLTEIGGAWMASMVMFAVYSLTSFFTCGAATVSGFVRLLAQLLTTNVLAVSLMVMVAYAVAVRAYRRGWDPDNFVIPLESSVADVITTSSLLIALTAIA